MDNLKIEKPDLKFDYAIILEGIEKDTKDDLIWCTSPE